MKSPIYDWLEARYEELHQSFQTDPPRWKALALYLAKGGVTDVDGKPPSAWAVRSSWKRLEAAKGGTRASE